MKVLKNKSIFSTVEKASNNFCIMRQVFYNKLLMHKYLNNSTYTKLTSSYSDIKIIDPFISLILILKIG